MDAAGLFDADLSEEVAAETLRDISIPPCPDVVLELLGEAEREDIDFIRVSRLITGDVALAAAVLKSANFPFFALRRKVQ
ncbi:MAG: HDOD domain-containing protein [Betaproteobacteria bacterium]|nr:HDOD domain-containing protein [Betaproteobacteria bacterium]